MTIILLYGCSQTRRLEPGQYLLTRNKIQFQGDDGKISQAEIEYLLKQKPNRKIFKYPFHLFIHNLPNREKTERKSEAKKLECQKRNLELQVKLDTLNVEIERNRKAIVGRKGRDSTRIANEIYRLEIKKIDLEDKMENCRAVLGHRMMYSIGEEPSILDSSRMETSVRNINLYLFKKGYFNNQVSSGVKYTGKKAEVIFTIKLGAPYKIRTINYQIKDRRLSREIRSADPGTLVAVGNRLDYTILDKERDRITTHLRDKGYHFFSKEFIYFDIDTTVGNMQVDLVMGVKNLIRSHREIPDSLIEVPHQKYIIGNIFVNTDFDPSIANSTDRYRLDLYDTLVGDKETQGIHFIYLRNKGISIKPKVLIDAIYIKRLYDYRAKEVEYTFKKLSSLGVFRTINIQFEVGEEDPTGNYLNCYINLSRLPRQNISIESNGTNRGGNLGIAGNFTYRNRNTFRGAETFRFSMSGGLEAQQALANEDQTIVGRTFNTLEFGPEIALYIPKFISPIPFYKFDKAASPRTVFTASLNYQDRPDFVRTIQNVSYAYEWKGKKHTSFYLSPVKLSAVKIRPDSSFTARLEALNDQFLLNSYRDHFIIGNQFRYEYNNQDPNSSKRNSVFFKVGLEQSGNLMRLAYELAGMPHDSVGSIFGIQFAQFLKIDADFRFTQSFNKSSRLVYRVAGGVGLPQKNFNQSLPFEKSFFVGGSNGLRGWKARTLGPGSYMGARVAFDKIGDIYLEGNVEYRFDLFGFLKGALFADAGNIWNLRENPARPGSKFTPNFYQELALDGGLGLRLDLDFFIIRFDFAIPLKEPGLMDGERWIFQDKTESNTWLNARGSGDYRPRPNLNLGIGYPF